MMFMGLSSSKFKQALYRQLVYYFPPIVCLDFGSIHNAECWQAARAALNPLFSFDKFLYVNLGYFWAYVFIETFRKNRTFLKTIAFQVFLNV